MHLDLIDNFTGASEEATTRIEVVIEPFRGARDLIVTIPGISTTVADVIIAETGGDMSRFPTAGHLASWAGTCPGSNESAGRVKSTQTKPGNPYLKGALGVAALSSRPQQKRLPRREVQANRVPARSGESPRRNRARDADRLPSGTCSRPARFYTDPGEEFFTRLNPDRAKSRALDQLRRMGYAVTRSNPWPQAG